ncbi:hypothetical protein CkaCkLH20_04741 [Colletotrichum karsti]|uniref:RRM domain-containing protein n=1 Tax=Colletotrichum karsti TaxID=1095194 RepID=A0A9P6LLX9_9PEZI|nr:uncharacterized protein CkaCkLH20_04741 [Colletotrichum karsti]KAF9877606.1 hypothetical protein CkaCkLH20_04741 [Colletotrichum karsti]
MATSSAQGASRKTNGVLPVSGQQATADAPKSNKSRAPVEGEKVVIRRLPPGLTEQELWNNLGDEWKAGQGLVSWHNFETGKISQDPAKSSKPARLYLHVLKRENLNTLSTLIQAKSWEDAKMTSNNPCLVGPPVLERALYNKIPSGKKRTDPRQGTIDQDPEFMAFLHSLTNPEQDKENDSTENKDGEESKLESKVTTTPLIEYLKEKKANKAKEAAAAKSAKQARESQNTKGKGSATAEETKKGKKDSKSEKSTDKPKETVKILTKKATAEAAKAAEAVASQTTQSSTSQSSAAASDAPKSRRAGIAAAARILQRDLGISPGSAHRRARLDAAKAEAEAKATTPTSKEAAQPAPEPPAPAAPPAAPAQTSSNATRASERDTAPTAPKSGRTRRGGGGKNAAANEAKGKSSEATSSNTPAPAKTPVVLLKKKDEDKHKEKPEKSEKAEKAEKEASSSQSAPAKSNPPTGPKSSGKGGNSKKGGSSSASVTSGATRGFVKHANPSQGVTENLLKQAMEAFGTVIFVEIDKRKGFAYVDFSDHESLVKAITASPVTVAQGTVQVLERKEKKPAASNSNANASSSSNAPAASSSTPAASKDKEASATASDKPEEQRHKRTRRGRGGGKAKEQAAAATAAADKAAGAG